MKQREIHYLLSHLPHGAYLVVSINSLRQWWDGPVIVHGWEHTGAWELVEKIGADSRLGVEARPRRPRYEGHRDHLLDKIALMESIYQVDSGLLLDADTIIVGELTELFEAAEQYGYAVTQFCNWKTTNSIIRNRVRRLQQFDALDQRLIQDCMETPYPSPNVGVFATVPGSPVMPIWYDWTYTAREVYIPDEAVMQALMPRFEREGIAKMMDGRWNCSTMRFQHIPDEEVRIWHGHGNSFLRPNKAPKGWQMWKPLYDEAWVKNLAGIQQWPERFESKHMHRLKRGGQWERVKATEV